MSQGLLAERQRGMPLAELQPVLQAQEVLALQQAVKEVIISEPVETYLLELIQASRTHNAIALGASPRAALAMEHASQAMAAIAGRTFVRPDEVKRLAPAVLSHRLILSSQARLRGRAAEQALAEILETVPVPVEALDSGESRTHAREQ